MKVEQAKLYSLLSIRRRGRYLTLLLGLTCTTIFLLSGCSSENVQGKQQSSAPQHVTMSSSWGEYYNNLSDLKKHADIAVRGDFIQIKQTLHYPKGQVYTVYAFNVKSILLDPHHRLQGSTVFIQQPGGTYNNATYESSDDPLFQVGEHSILFLRYVGDTASPNLYIVIGGPTGRFTIQNGIVKPVAIDGVQLPTSIDEQTFSTQIRG